jgi:hypothetical protein
VEAPADFERAENIVAVCGDDDSHRVNLIDAGVGGIERARYGIEADFAFDTRFEFTAQRRGIYRRRRVGDLYDQAYIAYRTGAVADAIAGDSGGSQPPRRLPVCPTFLF